MKIGRIFRVGLVLIIAAVLLFNVGLALFRDRLFDFEMARLDGWLANGASVKVIQTQVVEPCGKIIISQAGWFERIELMTIYKSEFDFRVDVCVKMTANRRYPQPEFQNAKLRNTICDNPNPYHEVFRRLCRRSGLRP